MMGNEIQKQVTLHRGIYLVKENEEQKIRIFLLFSGMNFPLNKMKEYENAVNVMD
jgi:hypothetical protein